MAEEVKIINDSMTCFSQQGDHRGLKNADLLNKSQSLKTVICSRQILEKSLEFVSSCTNHVGDQSSLFCKKSREKRVCVIKSADMYIIIVYIIIFVYFFLFSRLFVYGTHCTVITEKKGQLIKHKKYYCLCLELSSPTCNVRRQQKLHKGLITIIIMIILVLFILIIVLLNNQQLLDEVEQNIVICQWRPDQLLFAKAEG